MRQTAITWDTRQLHTTHGNYKRHTASTYDTRQVHTTHGNYIEHTAITYETRQLHTTHGNYKRYTLIGECPYHSSERGCLFVASGIGYSEILPIRFYETSVLTTQVDEAAFLERVALVALQGAQVWKVGHHRQAFSSHSFTPASRMMSQHL